MSPPDYKPPEPTLFRRGEYLIRAGDRGDFAYMIHQGQVQVYTKWAGRKVPLAVLGKTDIVGEMALLDNSPRSATVEALEDTYAVPITLDNLRESMRHNPETALTIIRVLVKKIRDTNNLLMNVLQGKGVSK